MIVALLSTFPSSRACPFKDALAFFQDGSEEVAAHARSLRGLLGAEDDPHSNGKIDGIFQKPQLPKPPTKLPSKAPSKAPTTASLPASTAIAPYCVKTNGLAAVTDKASMCTSFQAILADFNAVVPTNLGAQSDLFGKAVRLAFHDAGKDVVCPSHSQLKVELTACIFFQARRTLPPLTRWVPTVA